MKAKNGEFPSKEEMLDIFRSHYFRKCLALRPSSLTADQTEATLLSEYYDHYINSFHKDVEIEYKIPHYSLDGVPILPVK